MNREEKIVQIEKEFDHATNLANIKLDTIDNLHTHKLEKGDISKDEFWEILNAAKKECWDKVEIFIAKI